MLKKLLAFITAAQKDTLLLERIGVGIVILALTGAIVYLHYRPKTVTVTQTSTITKTVEVPKDHLVTKDVVKYVQDETQVKALLAENAKLKTQVTELNQTIANYQASGTGVVTQVATKTEPPALQPASPVTTPTVYDFKDWHLHFTTDGKNATYQLTQQFEILDTTGRDAKGTPINLVNLFEIGPAGKRIPITDTKTTSVFADGTKASWHLSPTITAGLGYTIATTPTTTNVVNATTHVTTTTSSYAKGASAIIGVRWLSHGKTSAAEDSTYAILTPVVNLNSNTHEFGVLPLSVNLGQIKHQPFKDLWVSPYVGLNGTGVGHVGAVIHASF